MYEYVIVGGGIHGTCIANYLLDEGGIDHADIRIVEPNKELLAAFARSARQCGMQTLRSTFVHHIAPSPFSLESFAEGSGREAELVSTEDYPPRPTLDLFLDHAQDVIDHRNVDACHFKSRVIGVAEHRETVRVETSDGDLDARHVVLAVGLGGGLTFPEWSGSLTEDAPLAHVWEDNFDPTVAATAVGRTIVVGGGITAAQVSCRLAETSDVTLLSRHGLETALSEADPLWINWRHIEKEIHSLPAGSQARYDRIRAARNDATIPPYVMKRLTTARNRADLDVRIGEIACVHAVDNDLLVRFSDGTATIVGQVVLATGLDPAPEHPLVRNIAQSLTLERGTNGFPLLDDQTLAWQRTDGTNSRVYVSGALAETTVGPFARNIVGARRVAERLLESQHRTVTEDSAARSKGES